VRPVLNRQPHNYDATSLVASTHSTLTPEVVTVRLGAAMNARGLLVRQPFADWIVDGRKTWEIRGSATKVRGRVAIIAAGTGTILGTCELCDVAGPLRLKDLRANARKLNVRASALSGPLYYGDHTYAWVLRDARRLEKPVRYDHPQGAVIWVSLAPSVGRRIDR